jgi:hypothetical protein
MSDVILCVDKGLRTIADARREVERRSRIQISSSWNIGFHFCKRSGDLEKCERKQYIPVWSAGYTAQYNAKNCGTFIHRGQTIRRNKQCTRHVVHETYYRVIGIISAIAHDFRSGQQGRSGIGEQLQCGRADSPRGKATVFLRQLKEENIIRVIWTPCELNSSDLYTKNLARTDFEKHTKAYVGDNKYMKG